MDSASPQPVPGNQLWFCDLGTVSYRPTVDLQQRLRSARQAGDLADTFLVLEHEPVITTGHRTEPSEVAYALTQDIEVVPTERGGKATYHGPGQLVVYPIVDLSLRGSDVRAYVCSLERALIQTLEAVGISADRRQGYPGVWVQDRKIASIGIRVTKWISYHGISLNVDCDLEPFGWFTPCGIPEIEMTSVARERAEAGLESIARSEVRAHLVAQLIREFGTQPVLQVDDRQLRGIAQLHEPAPGLVPVRSVLDKQTAGIA
jgi:lipoate-protein ligase B